MKTWVLGAVLGVPGLVALVACGSSSPSCPAGEMSVTELGVTVCAPMGTGAGTTTSTTTHMTTVTNSSSGSPTTTSSTSGSPTTTSSSSGGNGGSGGSSSGSCPSMMGDTATVSQCEDNTVCTTQADCFNCLANADPTGTSAANTLLVKDCGCASGSACASACATDPGAMCPNGGLQVGQACANCLNGLTGMEACFKTNFANDCKANMACITYIGEVQKCPMM